MINNHSQNTDSFVKWFDSLPKDLVEQKTKEEHEKTVLQYEDFRSNYVQGKCYLCQAPLKTFSSRKICLHYLLRPKGFQKKHFVPIYQKYSFHQIQAYLRWLANKDKPFGNINNLTDEMSEGKLFEITIKYKHLEWSFSCANGDFLGHNGSVESQKPHYHFQMRIDSLPFINYSDFHIPFSDYDLFIINMKKEHPEKILHSYPFGEGMEEVLSEKIIEEVIEHTSSSESEDNATFKFDTFIEAKPGETLNMDEISKIIEESNRTKKPMASLLKNIDAKVTTIVSPADGVPKIAKRTPRRRK